MTTVTIYKRKYELENLIDSALEQASTAKMGYYQEKAIENHPEQEPKIRFAEMFRRLSQYNLNWEKLNDVDMNDRDDLINAIGAILKKWNRRAGTRALVSKYGAEAASKIVEEKTGHHYTLRG